MTDNRDQKSYCDSARPLMSALVDGELTPVESIGVRRHVERCASCRMQLMSLEQLKLRVHVAGREVGPTEFDRERWARAVSVRASAHAATSRSSWKMPLAAAAAAVIGVLSLSVPSAHHADPLVVEAAESAQFTLSAAVLERLVDVHRGRLGHVALDDMIQAGALMTFEALPGTFIAPNSGTGLMQASFADCDPGSTVGSALAVLRASRVTLTPEAESALETSGVYVEVIGHTELRLTRGGERLFVLLRSIEPLSVGI